MYRQTSTAPSLINMYLLHRHYMFRNDGTCIAACSSFASLSKSVYHHLKALTGSGSDLDRVLSRSDRAGGERGTAGVGLGRSLELALGG